MSELGSRNKLVCGVGLNDLTTHRIYTDGVPEYEYQLWHSMLVRCYSPKALSYNPTYQKCKVSQDLLVYSEFKEFIRGVFGFGMRDGEGRRYQLDKDIVGDGSIYSKDTICFAPQQINKFLTKSDRARGEYPIGVSFDKRYGRYKSNIRFMKKPRHLGCFSSPEEAFFAYKSAKEGFAKDLAKDWAGKVDKRVIDALMNFEVVDDLVGGGDV